MPGLLSIGRFAHACRLSIKALRHYDEVGLLAPARVDGSGYRFYARGQIKTAISISLLRSLDVPIPAIRAILAAKNGAVAEKLDVERRRIERDLARSRRALSYVERMMREGEVLPYAIAIRDQPAATLLSLRSVTAPELHVEAGFALFEQLAAALREAKLPVGEPVLCILPEPEQEDTMVLEMCSHAPEGVGPDDAARAGLRFFRVPASRVAFTTHVGSYEEIGVAQHAVEAWVHEQGHAPTGAPREIYLDDPREVPLEARRTELVIPIAG